MEFGVYRGPGSVLELKCSLSDQLTVEIFGGAYRGASYRACASLNLVKCNGLICGPCSLDT
jgi:hypothetical protein